MAIRPRCSNLPRNNFTASFLHSCKLFRPVAASFCTFDGFNYFRDTPCYGKSNFERRLSLGYLYNHTQYRHYYGIKYAAKSGQSASSFARYKSTPSNQASALNARNGDVATSFPEFAAKSEFRSSPAIENIQEAPETFDNYHVAYGVKSTWELVRALGFFFLCRFPYVTDNAVQIMAICYKLLGKRAADFIVGRTAYDQFVAGAETKDIMKAVAKLRESGVSPIFCVPVESEARDSQASKEKFLDGNLEKIMGSIQLSGLVDEPYPMVQFRFTALMCGELLKTISTFCKETTHNMEVIDGIIAGIEGQEVDFSQLPGWENFPTEKTEEFQRALWRLGVMKEEIKKRDLIVLVDAEYTYINPALRVLGLTMMKLCNTDKAKLFYTYQAYLKATLSQLGEDINFARSNGFGFGLKLVRGAYMIQERQLAQKLGYDDPVNETFDLTCVSYHNCLDLLFDKVTMDQPMMTRFVIASHNEDTVRYAMKRMNELGIPRYGASVFFGQLYGMADHVSFTLGHKGYRVYKSIPYGPIDDTLPYLARRAQENKAILVNARRERTLVAKSLRDRMLFRA